METLYACLFGLTKYVAAILLFCLPFSIGEATTKQRLVYGLGILIFCGVIWVAYSLKQQGNLSAANFLLSIFWGCILGLILWAMMTVRWN